MVSITPNADKVHIDTNNPEREVWSRIGNFENEYFVRTFIKDRINRISNGPHFDLLANNKKGINQSKSNPRIETLTSLIYPTSSIVSEIANNARQSIEFYNALQEMPLLSKPIIVFFTIEKLANVLILSTFNVSAPTFSHGLTFNNDMIQVHPKGLFARLHDCYMSNPTLYSDKSSFKLESLINAGPIDERGLLDLLIKGGIASNKIIDGADRRISLHELDREFMFAFAISILSRYKVNDWMELIAGRYSDQILKIRKYMQSLLIFFPNLILNSLDNLRYLFYPAARLGGQD